MAPKGTNSDVDSFLRKDGERELDMTTMGPNRDLKKHQLGWLGCVYIYSRTPL